MEPTENGGGLDGVKPKKPKKVKPAKKRNVREDVAKAVEKPEEDKNSRGRLAADLRQRDVYWLKKPWIPFGMLSLVVGLPGVGKSTFMAWLTSQAGNAVIMPGYEETVEVTTLPRLVANGANLKLIRLLDDRPYRIPRDEKRIISILRGWEAELLVIDPIDSYMNEEMNENTGRDVRLMLESASKIASETGAAVVGVRHPGKDRINVMPGSRQWRAVPREIIELLSDAGTPPRLLIRPYKDSLGQDAKPHQFHLEGERGKPKLFRLGDEVEGSLADLSLREDGPVGRQKVMDACVLIRDMFVAEAEPTVSDLVGRCRTNGIGEHARDDAKHLLGIRSRASGFSEKYIMYRTQAEWPKWLPPAEAKT